MEISIADLKKYKIVPDNFEEIAKDKFVEFDKNGNGSLDYEECTSLIVEVAKFMKYESLLKDEESKKKIYEKFDDNGDNKITFDEFMKRLALVFINHFEEDMKKKK